jgi:hypothetical protein
MDIASWLREVRMSTNTSDWNAAFVNNRLDEAVNEIELLRKQLAHSINLGNSWLDKIDRLREALQFYSSFADALPHENIAPLMIDRGNKARNALKEGE